MKDIYWKVLNYYISATFLSLCLRTFFECRCKTFSFYKQLLQQSFFPFSFYGLPTLSALNTLTANTKELTHHINRKKGTNKVVLMKLIKLWSCYLPLIPKRMSSEISFLDASAKLLISSICFSSNL